MACGVRAGGGGGQSLSGNAIHNTCVSLLSAENYSESYSQSLFTPVSKFPFVPTGFACRVFHVFLFTQ